jgi:hypothetical protein
MNLDPYALLISLMFGCVGMGYFMYGKRSTQFTPIIIGLLLMIFPYFVASIPLMLIIGVGLSIAPIFLKPA